MSSLIIAAARARPGQAVFSSNFSLFGASLYRLRFFLDLCYIDSRLQPSAPTAPTYLREQS
jgi:hypothetical protein